MKSVMNGLMYDIDTSLELAYSMCTESAISSSGFEYVLALKYGTHESGGEKGGDVYYLRLYATKKRRFFTVKFKAGGFDVVPVAWKAVEKTKAIEFYVSAEYKLVSEVKAFGHKIKRA